ncbi:MAG TPA: hypothetical protein VFO60_08365 [Candidatus Dormibacteraeota bacterium]|nr:hypothetical protein [Candidatus Dormibacteraeota bacterium]
MDGPHSEPGERTQRDRVLARLDGMVAEGRVTAAEAARLREARDQEEFELAMGAVRARHAGSRLDGAVASGRMTPEEAGAWRERLREGEHPRELRGLLRGVEAPPEGDDAS